MKCPRVGGLVTFPPGLGRKMASHRTSRLPAGQESLLMALVLEQAAGEQFPRGEEPRSVKMSELRGHRSCFELVFLLGMVSL